jgi:hypothetical protein
MHEDVETFASRISPAAFQVMGYYGRAFARLKETADRIAMLQERIDGVQFLVQTRIAATDAFLDEQAVRLARGIEPNGAGSGPAEPLG